MTTTTGPGDVRSELPNQAWIELQIRHYVEALVSYHVAVTEADKPDVWVCQSLERLLGVEKGVDQVLDP